MAYCTRCEREKPDEDFSPSQAKRGRAWCRDCQNEARRPKRRVGAERPPLACGVCATPLEGKRSHARWCSDACAAKGWRAANPGRMREHQLKFSYGMLPGAFEVLLAKQNGLCGICSEPFNHGRNWHVDHCHKTGTVRGILCQRCNQGIGQLRDDPALLRRAITYLESGTSTHATSMPYAGDECTGGHFVSDTSSATAIVATAVTVVPIVAPNQNVL